MTRRANRLLALILVLLLATVFIAAPDIGVRVAMVGGFGFGWILHWLSDTSHPSDPGGRHA